MQSEYLLKVKITNKFKFNFIKVIYGNQGPKGEKGDRGK